MSTDRARGANLGRDLTPQQAADYITETYGIRIHRVTVRRMITRGTLKGFQVGTHWRVWQAHIDDLYAHAVAS